MPNPPPPPGPILVHITCPDADEARRIAHALVSERLAACANLHANESIYRWNDMIELTTEWTLTLKTTAQAFDRLAARVCEMHSDKLPCIIATPIAQGLPAFVEWIGSEVL